MKINQILWVIDGKTKSVIPVKIVERVTKETTEGTRTEFIVQTLDGKKANLNQINGKYFESIDDSKKWLLDSATEMINGVINRARSAAVGFGESYVQNDGANDIINQEQQATIPTDDMITLPDGRLARVRIKMPEIGAQ